MTSAGSTIWETSAAALSLQQLFEAKDEFPLGTIKQYGAKHLWVKVGGKKPWVYYATLGTEKANDAIAAGGVVVVDGKAAGPATPANLKKHGFQHPSVGGAPPFVGSMAGVVAGPQVATPVPPPQPPQPPPATPPVEPDLPASGVLDKDALLADVVLFAVAAASGVELGKILEKKHPGITALLAAMVAKEDPNKKDFPPQARANIGFVALREIAISGSIAAIAKTLPGGFQKVMKSVAGFLGDPEPPFGQPLPVTPPPPPPPISAPPLEAPVPPSTSPSATIGWSQFPDPTLASVTLPALVKAVDAAGGDVVLAAGQMDSSTITSFEKAFGKSWKSVYQLAKSIRQYAQGSLEGDPNHLLVVADSLPGLAAQMEKLHGPKWQDKVKAIGSRLAATQLLKLPPPPAAPPPPAVLPKEDPNYDKLTKEALKQALALAGPNVSWNAIKTKASPALLAALDDLVGLDKDMMPSLHRAWDIASKTHTHGELNARADYPQSQEVIDHLQEMLNLPDQYPSADQTALALEDEGIEDFEKLKGYFPRVAGFIAKVAKGSGAPLMTTFLYAVELQSQTPEEMVAEADYPELVSKLASELGKISPKLVKKKPIVHPMPGSLSAVPTPKKGPIYQAIKKLGYAHDSPEAKALALAKTLSLTTVEKHLQALHNYTPEQAASLIAKLKADASSGAFNVTNGNFVDFPAGAKKGKKTVEADHVVPPPPAVPAEIPPVSALTLKGSADHMGGAGKKQIYTDASGKEYLFKVAAAKGGTKPDPQRAQVQAAFSTVARQVKPNHPPIGAVTIKGVTGAIYPFIDAKGNLKGVAPAKLSDVEKYDVATEHILDWLGSQHDSHAANLLRTTDGRIVAIDKEQGFKYFGADQLSIDYHPNAKYGENEPFYNTFWRDWSEGDFDFDPKTLGTEVSKVEKISASAYMDALRPYAATRFPGVYEQERFLRQALARKLTLRRDYEKFLTGLYKKRTGSEGTFTFGQGWQELGEAQKPKIVTKTLTAKDYAETQNVRVRDFKTNSGTTDPTKLTLKVNKGSIADLENFLSELKLQALGPVKQGGSYAMVFVDRATFEQASITKDEVIQPASKSNTFPHHAGVPEYLPAVTYPGPAEPNSAELAKVETTKSLGESGKRYTVDGPAVEGQMLKVTRRKDAGGVYYAVHFKLRDSYQGGLAPGGTPKAFEYKIGGYDASSDTVSATGGTALSSTATEWQDQGSSISMASASGYWALQGSVNAVVRPKPGESFEKAFARLLDKMKPGLSKDILRDPSPDERETAKLARLLSQTAPSVHDGIPEKQRTQAKLLDALKGAGVSDSDIAAVKEVEVLPGVSMHVLPGQWKRAKAGDGSPALRYIYFAASTPSRIVNMHKSGGILGVHERLLSGKESFGASVVSDLDKGGADNVTLRVSVAGTASHDFEIHNNVSGSYKVIIAPDEADRLDSFLQLGDSFGQTQGAMWSGRRPLPDRVRAFNNSPNKANVELVLRRGVSDKKFLRIVADSESGRSTLLQQFKSEGITEVNGVPIEDYVVVDDTQGDVYKKYVQPAGY